MKKTRQSSTKHQVSHASRKKQHKRAAYRVPRSHHGWWRLGQVAGWLVSFGLLLALALYLGARFSSNPSSLVDRNILTKVISPEHNQPISKYGQILSTEASTTFDAAVTQTLIKQTNKAFAGSTQPITRQLIKYTSSDEEGRTIPIYARVYMPKVNSNKNPLPAFAFAPGTTGIDDRCAASLEQPAKANWANYDSLMAAYANAGYTVVVTDYEGMRDANRIHHYMIGDLEGRAVLDSIRAVNNLASAQTNIQKNTAFVAGYSQGGHAALWADKIAADYAPEVKLKGVIGFGPVSDVATTLADITRGANINWFGPFLLYSYSDFYHRSYDISKFLLPPWRTTLTQDIASHCINSVLQYWGRTPSALYQPAFLNDLTAHSIGSNFTQFGEDLAKNQAGNTKTPTPKLINIGQLDNVVLPSQSETLRQRLCSLGGGTVTKKVYPTATHYDTMVKSFDDTLAWMLLVNQDQSTVSSCN